MQTEISEPRSFIFDCGMLVVAVVSADSPDAVDVDATSLGSQESILL